MIVVICSVVMKKTVCELANERERERERERGLKVISLGRKILTTSLHG